MSLEKKHKPQGLFSSFRLSTFYALLFILGYLGVFAAADYTIRDSIVGRRSVSRSSVSSTATLESSSMNAMRSLG